jgi:hypothetical protein
MITTEKTKSPPDGGVAPASSAAKAPTEPAVPEVLVPFDYGGLSPAIATLARSAADYIRKRQRATTRAIIEIGQKLIEVKGGLDRGQFTGWLHAEFGWSERSAQNYMKAAQAFGAKTETVADLPVTTVYELARASALVREKVVGRIEAAPMPVEAVRTLLSSEKQAEQAAKADARLSPEEKRKEKAKRERQERERVREREESQQRQAAREAADSRVAVMIVERFGPNLPDLLNAIESGSSFQQLKSWLEAPYVYELRDGVRVAKPKPE